MLYIAILYTYKIHVEMAFDPQSDQFSQVCFGFAGADNSVDSLQLPKNVANSCQAKLSTTLRTFDIYPCFNR